MVVVLKPDTKEEQIENLKVWLSSMGISTHISRGVNHTIVGLVGDTSVVDMDLVRALDIVENVQRIQEPFKNANRKFHNADQVVDIAGVKIGGGNFQIIAGPFGWIGFGNYEYLDQCIPDGGIVYCTADPNVYFDIDEYTH